MIYFSSVYLYMYNAVFNSLYACRLLVRRSSWYVHIYRGRLYKKFAKCVRVCVCTCVACTRSVYLQREGKFSRVFQ